MNSAISPIIGLYVPQNNSSDLLSPHSLSGRSQSAAVLSRRVAELRGDENSSGNYLSSSRPIPLTPDGRRTKLYCSNAIMYSSSYDDRQNTSPFARIAHIEESVRRSSENSWEEDNFINTRRKIIKFVNTRSKIIRCLNFLAFETLMRKENFLFVCAMLFCFFFVCFFMGRWVLLFITF